VAKILHLSLAIVIIGLTATGYTQGETAVGESALTADVQLCTGIEDRMPVGVAESFGADVEHMYLWCKVIGAADTTFVKHVWSYEGKEMASVELPVRSGSWRTWSSKTILPEWTGNWEVKVLDANGDVLKAVSFRVGASEAPEPVEEAEPTDSADTTEP